MRCWWEFLRERVGSSTIKFNDRMAYWFVISAGTLLLSASAVILFTAELQRNRGFAETFL